jgi:hypothetical protein
MYSMSVNKKDQMHIIVQLASGQGIEQGGWPAEDKAAFINEDVLIQGAQLAEKSKLDGFFLTDIPGVTFNLRKQPPDSSLDPIVLMALMAKLSDLVEQVVPILQKRGLLRTEYSGSTLREHLGLPYQNGFHQNSLTTTEKSLDIHA